MLGASFVFLTIFSVKKLWGHPNSLIAYISLFEGLAAYNYMVWICSSAEYVEYFGLEYLLYYTSLTFLYKIPPQHLCTFLCVFNYKAGVVFFNMMGLSLNFCLCLDLIYQLRRPFYPPESMSKKFWIGSFLFSICMVGLSFIEQIKVTLLSSILYEDNIWNCISIVTFQIYLIMALFSVIYAY